MLRLSVRWVVACAASLWCAVTAAQGLTWATLHLGTAYDNSTCPMSQIEADKGAVLCVSLTFPSAPPTTGEVVCMEGALNVGGIGGIVLSAEEGGRLKALLNEAAGSVELKAIDESARLLPGRNEVAIAIDRGSAAADYPVEIVIFVNGQEAFTYEGKMSGITFSKITVGRGYDGGEDTPWDVSDATISARFARADSVIASCRAELARGGVLQWSAALQNNGGALPQPGWCGLFVLSGVIDTGTLADWVTAASLDAETSADYSLTEAFASRLLAKVRVKADAFYAELDSGSEAPLEFSSEFAAMDEQNVTFVFFNKSWGSAYVRSVSGLENVSAGMTCSLGQWSLPVGTQNMTVFAEALPLSRENLSIDFASSPLDASATLGIEPMPGNAWVTLGATEDVAVPFAGRSVQVTATGTLEGTGAPLMGDWLTDAAEGPAVRVKGLPEGLYSVIVYCGGNPEDTEGFRAVRVGSDNLPETAFTDLAGAAITAITEDGFGAWALGPCLGKNALRINNIPVGEGGWITVRGQPDEPIYAEGTDGTPQRVGLRRGTLAGLQILRRKGLVLDLGQHLRSLAYAIDFQAEPTLFDNTAAMEVNFIPTAQEIREATVTFESEPAIPRVDALFPIRADGRSCAVTQGMTQDGMAIHASLSGMGGFDALDLPESLGLLAPGAAVTVKDLTASTGLGDEESHKVPHVGTTATAIFVESGALPEGNVLYGGKLAKKNEITSGDIWMGISGGEYSWICGGDACADWLSSGTPARTREGNIVLWLREGTAKAIVGASYEGKNETRVKGNVLVTVDAPAQVTTRIIGGLRVVNANDNDAERPSIEGNVCVRVRTLLTSGDNLVGGSHLDTSSSNSAFSVIRGSTCVEVDIPEEVSGAFGMRIIGADLNQRDSYGGATTEGDASVRINAPKISFPKDIYAGCVGTNTAVLGNATLTLAGGTFSGTLAPSKFGTVEGISTLRLEGRPELKAATIEAFDRLVVARGAEVELPDFSAVECVELFSDGHTASVAIAEDASAYWEGKTYRLNNQTARAAYDGGKLTLSIGPIPEDADTWPQGAPSTERLIAMAEAAGIAEGAQFSVSAAAMRDGVPVALSEKEAREALSCFEGLIPTTSMARSAQEVVRFAYNFGVTAIVPSPETASMNVTVRVRNADGTPAIFAEGVRLQAVTLEGTPLAPSVAAPAGNAGELTLALPMSASTTLFRVEVSPEK